MNATKEQIERGCELVYEKVTGKCWHKIAHRIGGGDWGENVSYPVNECEKCNKTGFTVKNMFTYDTANPPLSDSLDAWRPLWAVMDAYKHWEPYDREIGRILKREGIWTSFTYDPLHHLEAALRAINLYDEVMG
jgi:hypothetical protein